MINSLDTKAPPHMLEAEKAVIGSMLLDREAIVEAASRLSKTDFYDPRHSLIFGLICELEQKGRPIDVTVVGAEIKGKREAETIGVDYLVEVMNGVSTPAHIKTYCEYVKNASIRRELINSCIRIQSECYDQDTEPRETLEKAEKMIHAISDVDGVSGLEPIDAAMSDAIQSIQELHDKKRTVTGLSTGFKKLDRITSGFHRGNLIVLAARPGVGKTSLALDVILHSVMRGKPVAFFSLEMSREEIMLRALSSVSGIPLYQIRNGQVQPEDLKTLAIKGEELTGKQAMYADCSTLNITPSRLRSSCRKLSGKLAREGKPLSLIVVDYLQLMSSQGKRYESRQAEVADISRSLKALAMDLKVPVMALSQLNRNTEERGGDGKPRLSDLRESGAIEQDADMVCFLWREFMYKTGAAPEDRAKTKLIIAKHRNGPLGEIDMTFVEKLTKFVEVESE